jgi:SagB-type dehydrogenase family enzyme
MVKKSAVTFIWVAVPYRMTWRYGERGYRYLLLDAGHVCQNLYLAAENISSGVCAIAAYHDAMFNELLGLDGENQFVIYLGTVGKKN